MIPLEMWVCERDTAQAARGANIWGAERNNQVPLIGSFQSIFFCRSKTIGSSLTGNFPGWYIEEGCWIMKLSSPAVCPVIVVFLPRLFGVIHCLFRRSKPGTTGSVVILLLMSVSTYSLGCASFRPWFFDHGWDNLCTTLSRRGRQFMCASIETIFVQVYCVVVKTIHARFISMPFKILFTIYYTSWKLIAQLSRCCLTFKCLFGPTFDCFHPFWLKRSIVHCDE